MVKNTFFIINVKFEKVHTFKKIYSAIRTSLNANPKQVREHIMNEVAQILACYRKNCANPSSAGQLVLPECMKLLPLYSNCVIKNDSISGGSEISTDDRSYLMHLVNGMDVKLSNVFFYPRLLPFVSHWLLIQIFFSITYLTVR